MKITVQTGVRPPPKPKATIENVCNKLNKLVAPNGGLSGFFKVTGSGVISTGTCANNTYTLVITLFSLFITGKYKKFNSYVAYRATSHPNAHPVDFNLGNLSPDECLAFLNGIKLNEEEDGEFTVTVE